MKFRIGHHIFNSGQGANRNVHSLVPVQASRKYHNEFVVISGSALREENLAIRKIEDRGAILLGDGGCPAYQLAAPDIVGRDHVIGESSGYPLHSQQQTEQESFMA